MNKKALLVLGLAVVFGGFTAAAVNRVIKGQANAFKGETQKVVVAVGPITRGQIVTPDQVKLEDRVKKDMPEGTISDINKVINRVALSEIAIGEAILVSRLAAEGSAAGVPGLIAQGMRAMTVKVDEVIGVAGFITPGTYVDVVATVLGNGLSGDSTSRIILQAVKVLASGKQIENDRDGGAVEVRTVTLEVMPDQAEVLALASTAGKLQLVLRNTTDGNEINTAGVTTGELFKGMGISRPAPVREVAEAAPAPAPAPVQKAPEPPKPRGPAVEVIQGSERSTVTFQ